MCPSAYLQKGKVTVACAGCGSELWTKSRSTGLGPGLQELSKRFLSAFLEPSKVSMTMESTKRQGALAAGAKWLEHQPVNYGPWVSCPALVGVCMGGN